ncbi:prephenate/arogenate dehydrogenase [Spirulina sp. 06S082]|uniref:prephenate/arogenate dehydrogenase n=1 Tax=Spirulina sp. 06S082 TaxID=3110248 RepID=UPI002B20D770|nr:prephenate/arogenate dehydrogenase [Spirulina sp. 06S082]MEA5468336.1 prephenate/arogenate dehydrogenase [Spirulina sp. 06S082]
MGTTVGIVGLGLIGGSLGLDLRSQGYRVIGVSRKLQTCQTAVLRKVTDEASIHLSQLATAEVIFICTPIRAIAPTIAALLPHLSPEAIVTDVGSVKTPIVEEITSWCPNFLGGHPMAGNESQGIDAAQRNLFVNAPYVLTPVEDTSTRAIAQLEAIIGAIGARLYSCSPQQHDRAVAWISHLPLLASAGLIASCLGEEEGEVLQLAQQFASSGFRDTSRVGGGNPELGVEIARSNRGEILRSLSRYRQNLDGLIAAIEQEDWQKLANILQHTESGRKKFVDGR